MSFKTNNHYINHKQFLSDTVDKIQNELTKFIIGTNYSNPYSIYLREQLDDFQKNLEKTQIKKENKKVLTPASILPILKQNIHPNLYYHPTTIYKLKPDYKKNKNFEYPLNPSNKYIVKTSLQNELIEMKNKYLKYSNESNNRKYFSEKLYDSKGFPVIRNKEMKKGLYDMVTKGLVPKIADLSPAIEIEGNPLKINSNVMKTGYTKNNMKDEIIDLHNNNINIIKYSMEDILSSKPKTVQNDNKNSFSKEITEYQSFGNKTKEDLFLTANIPNNIFQKMGNEELINLSNTANSYFNYSYSNKGTFNNQIVFKTAGNFILSFNNYIPVIDKMYNQFKNKNKKKWDRIQNIFDNFTVLFKKLNLNDVRVDSNKILSLIKFYKDNISNIRNKDLLLCITNKDLIKNGLDPQNEKMFYQKIKEAFIIKLQKMVRKRIAYNKYNILKYTLLQTIRIQSTFRKFIVKKEVKEFLDKEKELKHVKFLENLNFLKSEWNSIQESNRFEIHINSLSYDNYKNTTIGKYSEKENLQLNRLIRLFDPNLEIIYISPYKIQEEILRYYFSILENVGIMNIEERFHLIIPDSVENFPPNYSLSNLVYFSKKCQIQIKKIIGNKFAYIVPGIPNNIEEKLSYILDIPVLMGDYSQIENVFNKSGVKNSFELNYIPFPISAWDIKNEEEFYSSLAHLIATYPTINIWLFKINTEHKGRGIAYLNTGKIQFIQDLKKEKLMKEEFTLEIFQEKLYYQLKNILIKNVQYVYSNFYNKWNDYLKQFLENKGIIESYPTRELDGIMGHPCVPILIEPNGNVKVLPTFDKYNIDYFKNFICTSPQKSMDNDELNAIGEKMGNFLYKQEIIGYITLEFITFHNGKKVLYWAIDMIYGLTDQISSLQYGYFLYLQTTYNRIKPNEFEMNLENLEEKENLEMNYEKPKEKEMDLNKIFNDVFVFVCPILISKYISQLKLKEFLRIYRYENLVFDLDKREGIIFNFPDGLECGIFGICGVTNLDGYDRNKGEYKLWTLIEKTILLLKGMLLEIRKKDHKTDVNVYRNDIIDIQNIYSKVKSIFKEKGKTFEQEKKILNKGNSFI